MPRINLLPWREQQRVERKKAFGVGMFGAAVGALLVAAVGSRKSTAVSTWATWPT
jgi:Tfp pilus assembly protein PilN